MSHRQVINSNQLSTHCYVQLNKHTHYNYLYANLLKQDATREWMILKLNSLEIQVINKSTSIIDEYIQSTKSKHDFVPLFLRSKSIILYFVLQNLLSNFLPLYIY